MENADPHLFPLGSRIRSPAAVDRIDFQDLGRLLQGDNNRGVYHPTLLPESTVDLKPLLCLPLYLLDIPFPFWASHRQNGLRTLSGSA